MPNTPAGLPSMTRRWKLPTLETHPPLARALSRNDRPDGELELEPEPDARVTASTATASPSASNDGRYPSEQW
jgi:hypothetical protein